MSGCKSTTSPRRVGWLILAAVSSLMAALALLDAVYRLFVGEPLRLLWLVVGIPFWYWIGVGAWRRANRSSS